MNYYNNGLKMKFPVSQLVSKLKENRARHNTIATEAKKNYLNALKAELEDKLTRLGRGEKVNPNSRLPIPGDNLEEYDTAISMLELTSDETIELVQGQYHAYVEDKWDWQKNFLDTAANYSVGATRTLDALKLR